MTPTKAKKFLTIAKAVSELSKDPSTKVGAVAINEAGAVLSVGYNGFPAKVEDTAERYHNRDTKLALIAHAEQNLVAQAASIGVALKGCTVVISGLYPCSSCAKSLIQAGVVRIVTPASGKNPRWVADAAWSELMFKEAGIEIVYVEEE